ncbi:MAG: hypothetical protein R2706_11100 [Acidimicrobiales bacterium]
MKRITSRGDRRLGVVIEEVWRTGGIFQEWGEHFDVTRWTNAMASTVSMSTGTPIAIATKTKSLRGTTCQQACTETSFGRTGVMRSTK